MEAASTSIVSVTHSSQYSAVSLKTINIIKNTLESVLDDKMYSGHSKVFNRNIRTG